MTDRSIEKTAEYKICLHGAALDLGNMGSRALAASFIKLAVESRPDAKLYMLYPNRTAGKENLIVADKNIEIEIVNCRLSPKSKLNEHLFWIFFLALLQRIMPVKSIQRKLVNSNRWLRTLDEADFVGEIRGGDSFSDIYGPRRFLLGVIPCIIAILMRKDLVMLPQTYGPFKTTISKAVAGFILKRSEKIFSRDKDSIQVVEDLSGKIGQVQFCPDVAFTMEPVLPKNPEIHPPLNPDRNVPLIGLNVSVLLYIGGFTQNNMFGLKTNYKDLTYELLNEILKNTDSCVMLVPHVFGIFIGGKEYSETDVCKEIYESLDEDYRSRVHYVSRKYDQNNIKGIIGMCDFFIGARMHACIAALSQNIPTVGLAYSKKFRGIFETIEAERYVLDMRRKDKKEIINEVLETFDKRDQIAKDLTSTIPEIKERISNIFKDMLG